MSANKDFSETDLKQAENTKTNPTRQSSAYSKERIYRSDNTRYFQRVCPYCLKTIPANEDPCHYCGHLEPAASAARQASESRSNNWLDAGWLVVFLVIAMAMIVWPQTSQLEISSCPPDQEISCFFQTSWNVQGGIIILILCTVSLILNTISNHLRH